MCLIWKGRVAFPPPPPSISPQTDATDLLWLALLPTCVVLALLTFVQAQSWSDGSNPVLINGSKLFAINRGRVGMGEGDRCQAKGKHLLAVPSSTATPVHLFCTTALQFRPWFKTSRLQILDLYLNTCSIHTAFLRQDTGRGCIRQNFESSDLLFRNL